MWTSVDYELDWPRELLRDELLALRDHPYRAWSGNEVELLLTEAFHSCSLSRRHSKKLNFSMNDYGQPIDPRS